MTHTIDANLLLYASDSSSPFHDRAIELIDDMATSPEIVYLFWPTVMAYLRIATHPAVFDELDLPFGKGPHRRAGEGENADWNPLAQQWHGQHRAVSA